MRLPLLLYLRTGKAGADVIVARTWELVTLILAGICEVNLLANGFDLLLLLRPGQPDVVVAGRGRVELFLMLADEIEVGLLGGSTALEGRLLEPDGLLIGVICMGRKLLAGPGEQLSLMD